MTMIVKLSFLVQILIVDPHISSIYGASAIIDAGDIKNDVLLDHEMFDTRGYRLRKLNMIESNQNQIKI